MLDFSIYMYFQDGKQNHTTEEKRRNSIMKEGRKSVKVSGKEWCNIQDGYGHLLDDLEPDNPDSEVDKVVKYILEKNIQVRLLNVKSCDRTNLTCGAVVKRLKKLYPDIKVGRFSRRRNGEDDIIKQNWKALVTKAKIRNPSTCFEDFMKLNASIF